jgi:uncharacterized protein (DUF1800 family)
VRRRAAIVLAAIVAAGCVARLAPPPVMPATASPARGTPAVDDGALVHALSRLGFGPRPGDVERVKATGLERWLGRQLEPAGLDDAATDRALAALPTLAMSIGDLQRQYPRPDKQAREQVANGAMSRREMMERYPPDMRPFRIVGELQAARMLRAVESERQLQEVMVDFWFNHFNVHAAKGEVTWYVSAYERDVIRPNALGKFGDLLRATARHPAMLFYLDNWLSTRADFTVPAGPNRGRRAGLNENYARELMELHTLGVDGGYTQKDVTEVARAFTGWTIERPREEARFVFRPARHDRGEKTVLGARLRAGGGEQDGERVLELLLRHPSTARFIATKLVRRFVADEPPPALVERVAGTYAASDGDVRAMLRTLVAAPEFWSAEARRAKIKKPFEFVASAVRALGGHADARGGWALARAAAEMGEGLYAAQPPTGYPDRAEAWVNAGALLARMNFALALTQRRVPGVTLDLAPLAADGAAPEAALDRLLAALLHGGATPQTRAVLAAQLVDPQIRRQTADDRGPADTDVAKLAALVIGSPEFQRR